MYCTVYTPCLHPSILPLKPTHTLPSHSLSLPCNRKGEAHCSQLCPVYSCPVVSRVPMLSHSSLPLSIHLGDLTNFRIVSVNLFDFFASISSRMLIAGRALQPCCDPSPRSLHKEFVDSLYMLRWGKPEEESLCIINYEAENDGDCGIASFDSVEGGAVCVKTSSDPVRWQCAI